MDLFSSNDKFLQFWPNSKQSYKDRIDSAARFVIYASFIAYMMKRDNRIIGLAAFVLIIIFLFRSRNPETSQSIPREPESFFPASRWTDRQFYTTPEDDMDKFLNFVHGGKRDTCRTNPEMCDPDTHPRMIEPFHTRGGRLV